MSFLEISEPERQASSKPHPIEPANRRNVIEVLQARAIHKDETEVP